MRSGLKEKAGRKKAREEGKKGKEKGREGRGWEEGRKEEVGEEQADYIEQ